jgi:hypothetical protein
MSGQFFDRLHAKLHRADWRPVVRHRVAVEVGVSLVTELSNEDAARILESLTNVGPRKAVGYLPLYTIHDFVNQSVDAMIETATADGLAAICLTADRCCIKSGALYVYDRGALAQLLHKSADILAAHDLTADPDRFVLQIAARWFEREHPVYSVIAAAFGEGAGTGKQSGGAVASLKPREEP